MSCGEKEVTLKSLGKNVAADKIYDGNLITLEHPMSMCKWGSKKKLKWKISGKFHRTEGNKMKKMKVCSRYRSVMSCEKE
jgi:hypothetical protein